MALDCVPFHDGSVAAAQLIGNPVLRPIGIGVVYILRLRTEAVCSQMLDPRAAAASGRALVNGDLGPTGIFGRAGRKQQRRTHNGRFQESSHKLTPFKSKMIESGSVHENLAVCMLPGTDLCQARNKGSVVLWRRWFYPFFARAPHDEQ